MTTLAGLLIFTMLMGRGCSHALNILA